MNQPGEYLISNVDKYKELCGGDNWKSVECIFLANDIRADLQRFRTYNDVGFVRCPKQKNSSCQDKYWEGRTFYTNSMRLIGGLENKPEITISNPNPNL